MHDLIHNSKGQRDGEYQFELFIYYSGHGISEEAGSWQPDEKVEDDNGELMESQRIGAKTIREEVEKLLNYSTGTSKGVCR